MSMPKFLVTAIACLLIITMIPSCVTPTVATAAVLAPAVVGAAIGVGIGVNKAQQKKEEEERRAKAAEAIAIAKEAEAKKNGTEDTLEDGTLKTTPKDYIDITSIPNTSEPVPVISTPQFSTGDIKIDIADSGDYNDDDYGYNNYSNYSSYDDYDDYDDYDTSSYDNSGSEHFLTISSEDNDYKYAGDEDNENYAKTIRTAKRPKSNTQTQTTVPANTSSNSSSNSDSTRNRQTRVYANMDPSMMSLKDLIFAGKNEEAKERILSFSDINCVIADDSLTSLHVAAMANNAELVTWLLEQGADPEIRNSVQDTPLHTAVKYDAPEAAQALVDGGANYFAVNKDQRTAFSLGIEKSKSFYPVFILQPVGEVRDVKGQNLVHYFIKTEDIDGTALCIERGLSLDYADNNGKTPLALAYENKDSAVSAALGAALILSDVTPLRGEYAYFENTVKTRNARQIFDDEQTGLHLAVIADHQGIAQYFISCGALLNAQDIAGSTPLHLAVRYGRTELVKILTEAGADVNACDSTLKTPLLITAPKGKQDEIYEILLAHDADASVQDLFGDNALHIATMGNMSTSLLTKLINKGALVNTQNKKGITPLEQAVIQKNTAHISTYVSYGADLFAEDVDGNTPLTLCIKDGNLLKLMVTSANIYSTDFYGNTPLHVAVEHKATQGSVRYLLDAGIPVDALNCYGEPPLFSALKSDNYNAVQQLIKAGAQTNLQDNLGNTALHTAVRWTAEKSLKKLLSSNYDVNIKNQAGKTPLAEAARQNRINIMKMFISKGADVNAADVTGKTVLMDAVQCKNPAAAQLLIQKGASSQKQDMYGRNAFHEAASSGSEDLVALIKKTGVDPLCSDKYGKTPFSLALGYNYRIIDIILGNDHSLKDEKGNTPLHIAIKEHAPLNMIEHLIELRYPLDALNSDGETALLNAVRLGMNDEAALLMKYNANPLAGNASIDSGYGTNAVLVALHDNPSVLTDMVTFCRDKTDTENNTLLHFAAAEADANTLSVLINYGADKRARNADGETPADVAARVGQSRAVIEALQ